VAGAWGAWTASPRRPRVSDKKDYSPPLLLSLFVACFSCCRCCVALAVAVAGLSVRVLASLMLLKQVLQQLHGTPNIFPKQLHMDMTGAGDRGTAFAL